jgi:long-chain acyl-CoA synthetase
MSEDLHARAPVEQFPNSENLGDLFSILQKAAASSAEKTALLRAGRSLSFKDLHSTAELLAAKLVAAGIIAGDTVGLMASNTLEYITMFFATARIGAIIVPIPQGSKQAEVSDLAGQIDLNAFFYSRSFAPLIPDSPMETAIETTVLPDRPSVSIRRRGSSVIVDAEGKTCLKTGVGMIRFSSGTTGKAKGVILSTNAILARAKTFSLAYSLNRNSCVLHLLSPELATPTLLGCMLQGSRVVVEDIHKFESIARLIRIHGVTHIHASPLFYGMMVGSDAIHADDLRSVRYVISTGAPLANPVAKAFAEKFGCEIFQYYALAECGTVFANTSQDIEKRGSSGVLLPSCEVQLVNSSSAGTGEIGELLVRGSGLFEGYCRPWRLRDEILEDGWFRTGDVARRDVDGYYWIVGRTKDLINVGGVKVFPDEIEEVLLSHPTVDEAVVFGAPDPRFGEVPRAKVALVPGSTCEEKELLDFSNQRLSVFRRLRSIEIVPELPKTPTGKLKRTV